MLAGTAAAYGQFGGALFTASEGSVNAVAIAMLCIPTALGYALDVRHVSRQTVFVGTMPAATGHASALAVAAPGQRHGRALQVGYRVTF